MNRRCKRFLFVCLSRKLARKIHRVSGWASRCVSSRDWDSVGREQKTKMMFEVFTSKRLDTKIFVGQRNTTFIGTQLNVFENIAGEIQTTVITAWAGVKHTPIPISARTDYVLESCSWGWATIHTPCRQRSNLGHAHKFKLAYRYRYALSVNIPFFITCQ